MRLPIDQRLATLTGFIHRACAMDDGDIVRKSLLQFGAVLVCGFVERSVEIVILERLKNRAQPKVLTFIKSHFKRGTNYDCEAVAQLLSRFDQEWELKFRNLVGLHTSLEEQIKSCYSVRNAVAHGSVHTVSEQSIRDYLDSANRLVDCLIGATE